MEHSNGYTEQCKDWSDRCTERINCHAAHAAAHDRQATAHPQPAGHPRLPDHALHALWQTTLPLCDRTWAWSQILALGEQRRETPPAPLCAPGHGCAGATAVGSLPDVARPPGGAVRHRLRVADAPRRPVARSPVVGQLSRDGVCDRRDGCWSTGGQYVGTRKERPALGRAATGGGSPCTSR